MSNCTYKNFWSTFLLHWKYVATIWLHFRLAHIYLSNNLIFSDQITGCKSKAHVKMCSNNDQFDIFCQVQQKRMWENEKPNRNKNADSKWDFLIPLGRSHVKKSIRMKNIRIWNIISFHVDISEMENMTNISYLFKSFL